jgi:hypothetical protein
LQRQCRSEHRASSLLLSGSIRPGSISGYDDATPQTCTTATSSRSTRPGSIAARPSPSQPAGASRVVSVDQAGLHCAENYLIRQVSQAAGRPGQSGRAPLMSSSALKAELRPTAPCLGRTRRPG